VRLAGQQHRETPGYTQDFDWDDQRISDQIVVDAPMEDVTFA
jgi:hypothetical protein